MVAKSFTKLYEEARSRDSYWVADKIYTFTEGLAHLAEVNGITRSEIARRLDVSPAYITKVFSGDVNFTIESMVRLARVVDGQLHLHVAPIKHEVKWFEIPQVNWPVAESWLSKRFTTINMTSEAKEVKDEDRTIAA